MISRCLYTLVASSTLFQSAALQSDEHIRRTSKSLQVQIDPNGAVAASFAQARVRQHAAVSKKVAHSPHVARSSSNTAKKAAGLHKSSMFALARTRSLFSFRSLFGVSSTPARTGNVATSTPGPLHVSDSTDPVTEPLGEVLQPSRHFYQSGIFITLMVFIGLGLILSVIGAISVRMSPTPPLGVEREHDADWMGANRQPQQGDEGVDEASANQQNVYVEREIVVVPEGLSEDIYGMGIAAIIRDMQRFSMNTELKTLRMSRLGISLLSLSFCAVLQVFLLVEMKHLVTSVSTMETRSTYDKFEVWMYGNDTEAMTITDNGYHRGVPGHMDISRFATLDPAVKDSACQIPLSQPTFFIGVLLIWTFVIVADLRRVFNLGGSLIQHTPTVDSMRDATQDAPPGAGEQAVMVVGLTVPVKIMIVVLILLPRLAVDGALLWLGCRWLCGTMGFSDILQNTVTLEFILLLKDLFYHTMAPHHNKLETRNTMILPSATRSSPSAPVFLGAFAWGILGIVWVLLYVECLQQVLPEYNWDIHDVCQEYLLSVEGQGGS